MTLNIDFSAALDANNDGVITNIDNGSPVIIPEIAILHNDAAGEAAYISSVSGAGAVLASPDVVFSLPVPSLSESDFAQGSFTLQAESEPNDTLATAQAIARAQFTDGSVRPGGASYQHDQGYVHHAGLNGHLAAGGQDWFQIDLAAGEKLWFDVDNATVDTDISIFNGDGILVAVVNNSWGDPWGGFVAGQAGDYYVQVSGHTSSESGNYELYMSIDAGSADYGAAQNGEFSYTLNDGALSDTASVDVTTTTGDTLNGSERDDILIADDTGSVLLGNAGDDALVGGAGDDTLHGGTGDDLLIGGQGNDTLSGGAGHDVFYWQAGEGDGSTDVITDFTAGQGGDVLDFHELLSDEHPSNITDYLAVSSDGSNTTITVDTDGSGNAGGSLTVLVQGVDLTVGYTDGGGNVDQAALLQHLLDDGNLVVDH
jgi:Ca2+-binding RTX toxin-like protein